MLGLGALDETPEMQRLSKSLLTVVAVPGPDRIYSRYVVSEAIGVRVTDWNNSISERLLY